jgi:D-arabinose 5-phosphate isomerase GutQ
MNDDFFVSGGNPFNEVTESLRRHIPEIIGDITVLPSPARIALDVSDDVCNNIEQRLKAINQQVLDSVQMSRAEIEEGVHLFLRWMNEGTIVRVIGAGRARLAAAIPANRLAHGGARVYVQDDIIPMPHTINGGGIIAASASGTTETVLSNLKSARQKTRDIKIVGVASSRAVEFKSYCDIFIGIQPEPAGTSNPLKALADTKEYVLSELLDAMVVAAGKLGGFDDTRWRLGHEDLGPTGPYDFS